MKERGNVLESMDWRSRRNQKIVGDGLLKGVSWKGRR